MKKKMSIEDVTPEQFTRARNAVRWCVDLLHRPTHPSLGLAVIGSVTKGYWEGNVGLNVGLEAGLRDGLDVGLRTGLHAGLDAGLRTGLNVGVDAGLNVGLDVGLRTGLHAGLDAGLRAGLPDVKLAYCGIWWTRLAAQYLAAAAFGCKTDWVKLAKLIAFIRYTPLVGVVKKDGKELPVVLPNPTSIHWREIGTTDAPFSFPILQLHNESGPSVSHVLKCATLWHIDGIQVDEQIVMHPDTQTVEQINSEHNEDVKTIRIERFGWLKYLDAVGATLIDERQNDVEGTLEQLYTMDDGSRRFVATCPTGKIPVLGVPGSIETCERAASWVNPFASANIIGRT